MFDVKAAVYRDALVKDTLFLPILHFFLFAVILLAVTGFILLAGWAGAFNPAAPEEPGWLSRHIIPAIGSGLTASVLLSLFFLFRRIRRKPGIRLLMLILPVLTCFLLISAGFGLLYGQGGSSSRVTGRAVYPFIPGVIHSVKDGPIYIDSATAPDREKAGSGIEVEGIVRLSAEGLVFESSATAIPAKTGDGSEAELIPASDPSSPIEIQPASPVYGPMFPAPGFLQGIVSDAGRLNRYLLETRERSTEEFLLAVFALSLAASGCITFSRLFRWPLFSALITIVMFRGIFLLLRFIESDIGQEMTALVTQGKIVAQIPTAVYLVFGVILIAIDLLFVKESKIRERLAGG
ncbi:MAG: hypothetical protein HN368_19165 [Spirochaetales bacterium]|nr:hypothetical protein [Spirochaetales bacterium]